MAETSSWRPACLGLSALRLCRCWGRAGMGRGRELWRLSVAILLGFGPRTACVHVPGLFLPDSDSSTSRDRSRDCDSWDRRRAVPSSPGWAPRLCPECEQAAQVPVATRRGGTFAHAVLSGRPFVFFVPLAKHAHSLFPLRSFHSALTPGAVPAGICTRHRAWAP